MTRPPLSRLLFHASTGKLNLFALASAVAMACLSGQAGVLLAGALLYTLLVARDLSSESLVRSLQAADAEELRRLPEISTLTEDSLRVVVRALHKGYGEIRQAVEHAPEPILAHVRVALSSVEELRPQASLLIREIDRLHCHLEATSRDALERGLARLRDGSERAPCDARREWACAIALREEQLAGIDRLQREHDRLFVTLQSLVAAVETFPSRVHQLCLLEARARQDVVRDVGAQLLRLDGDLAESQRLLEGLVEDPE
jgi:hypothetical protein